MNVIYRLYEYIANAAIKGLCDVAYVHILALNPSVIPIHALRTLCASPHPSLVSLLFSSTPRNAHAQPRPVRNLKWAPGALMYARATV